MVTTATMSVILAMWMTVIWAITYAVTNHRREKELNWLRKELSEYILLVDELMYGDQDRDGYAEYEVQEDGTWTRVN